MSKNTFNAADDEQLVELVAGHRILWDYSDNDFKNTLKKELIWKEIARLLNKTGTVLLIKLTMRAATPPLKIKIIVKVVK